MRLPRHKGRRFRSGTKIRHFAVAAFTAHMAASSWAVWAKAAKRGSFCFSSPHRSIRRAVAYLISPTVSLAETLKSVPIQDAHARGMYISRGCIYPWEMYISKGCIYPGESTPTGPPVGLESRKVPRFSEIQSGIRIRSVLRFSVPHLTTEDRPHFRLLSTVAALMGGTR